MKLLPNTYLYKTTKIKKSKKKRISRIQKYANKLNRDIPLSEQWFRALYNKEVIKSKLRLKYNYPIGKYIPDCINLRHMIIIEIDGSIHNTSEVMYRDVLKDTYYADRGFKVIRIKAYDLDSYKSCITQLNQMIDISKVNKSVKNINR